MLAIILAAALVPLVPDPGLTPGATNPAIVQANIATTICVPGYTARPGVRHVTAATKAERFRVYGVDPKAAGPFEIDHLISLELGGSNAPANLWPQSYVSTPWNAHLKDDLEDRLHALVCSGKLPLDVAQKAISTAWIAAYQTYVATPNPAP